MVILLDVLGSDTNDGPTEIWVSLGRGMRNEWTIGIPNMAHVQDCIPSLDMPHHDIVQAAESDGMLISSTQSTFLKLACAHP